MHIRRLFLPLPSESGRRPIKCLCPKGHYFTLSSFVDAGRHSGSVPRRIAMRGNPVLEYTKRGPPRTMTGRSRPLRSGAEQEFGPEHADLVNVCAYHLVSRLPPNRGSRRPHSVRMDRACCTRRSTISHQGRKFRDPMRGIRILGAISMKCANPIGPPAPSRNMRGCPMWCAKIENSKGTGCDPHRLAKASGVHRDYPKLVQARGQLPLFISIKWSSDDDSSPVGPFPRRAPGPFLHIADAGFRGA